MTGHASFDSLVHAGARAIRVGSKSFSVASLLFPKTVRRECHLLYSWCRHCDDLIDRAVDPVASKQKLEEIRAWTRLALEEKAPHFLPLPYQSLRSVFKSHQIPHEYAWELIAGLEMDVDGYEYESESDLRLYCYRVAGTIGLMMAHIMGISCDRALRHAVNLGMGMQMSNIARDIAEDHVMGRTYIPSLWLREEGLNSTTLMLPEKLPALTRIASRLAATAESHYTSAYQGLCYLSFRSAFAVAAAGEIYSSIGKKVVRRGLHAWSTRTYIGPTGKFLAILRACGRVLATLPTRMITPWRKGQIRTIWRHS